MTVEFSLQIRDVLNRPIFQNAQVIAGENGLARRIRWVHILEVTHFDSLIQGEEMILSTGVGFNTDEFSYTDYLEKLIELNVSCLCLEMGSYLKTIPQEMIEIANLHHFPIIIFPEKVRFVDITQDLHTLIINRHHETLRNLETVSREFHRLTLTSQGTLNVLKLLNKSSKAQIVYIPFQGQPNFIPSMNSKEEEHWLDFFNTQIDKIPDFASDHPPYQLKYNDKTVLFQPVGALGQTWAIIVMLMDHEPHEYHYLVLDSASISIAQDLLRKRYIEERKHHVENVWVGDLLHHRVKEEEQLRSLLGSEYQQLNHTSFQVCLIQSDQIHELQQSQEAFESIQFHVSLMIRNTFVQFGFNPLIHLKDNRIVVIALDPKSEISPKERLRQVFESLQKIKWDNKTEDPHFRIGVGQSYVELKNVPKSYQEAIHAQWLHPIFKKTVTFYDEIGTFQLLVNLRDGKILESFIYNHLGSIIEEDQSKGSELLHTLKVYLDHNGSKQLAAQKLFIVRQSLYYRLEKINELLGQDLMSAEKRLALQVALLGYQLLHPDKIRE